MKYEYRLVIPDMYSPGTLFQEMQGYYIVAENHIQATACKAHDLAVYYRVPTREMTARLYVDHTWTRPIRTEIN